MSSQNPITQNSTTIRATAKSKLYTAIGKTNRFCPLLLSTGTPKLVAGAVELCHNLTCCGGNFGSGVDDACCDL